MVKRAVSDLCVRLGSLTGDAIDRRARSVGRGERSALRQDGGPADRADSRVDRFARPRALLRVPSRRWGAPAARHALDRYTGLSSALDCAVDASMSGARERRQSPHRVCVTRMLKERNGGCSTGSGFPRLRLHFGGKRNARVYPSSHPRNPAPPRRNTGGMRVHAANANTRTAIAR